MVSGELCPHASEFPYLPECKRCRDARNRREADERMVRQAAWFEHTGFCGACGQPGDWCQCKTPCGCAGLHECGSGVGVDPVEMFADAPVSDEQQAMF